MLFCYKYTYLYMQLELLFWPVVQAINFRFVPPAFRVIYLNCFYVCWSMILSYLKHHVSHCSSFNNYFKRVHAV